ncbi:hypothetical protein [Paenibacillus sp. Y412MC10]|uniref:hypothetical protein n=1 Tax=Geobacillus sp. (strain Y412MC10) TaxID=481743 RepID=UPI001642ACFA|nr:hypothetical protein [Paenibacillus sp. Y412MC10]
MKTLVQETDGLQQTLNHCCNLCPLQGLVLRYFIIPQKKNNCISAVICHKLSEPLFQFILF